MIQKYKLIDISMPMDAFTFPGNPQCVPYGPQNRISSESANREYIYDFLCCTQSGTHIQGPHYFLEKGKKINDLPLSAFEGEAYLVDIFIKEISKNEIEEKIRDLDLENRILILRSGYMDRIIETGEVGERPSLSIEAAKYLVENKKIKMIAIDSIGIESRVTKNNEVNVYFCEHEVLILECLINLDKISKKKMFLEAFPLYIDGVEGTPCRAIVKEGIE